MINLQDVLNELAADVSPVEEAVEVTPAEPEIQEQSGTSALKTDDELLEEFIVSELKKAIRSNNEIIEENKDLAISSRDPMMMDAQASLVKSHAELIKNLSSLHMSKQKRKLDEKLKTRDLNLKERQINNKIGDGALLENGEAEGNKYVQNNLIISDRDTICDFLFETNPESKARAAEKLRQLNGK